MARLEVRLLGGFELVVDGRPITGFESATDRALLARLAAEPGRTFSRTALAELLWPGRPSGQALGNLRHSLAVLRRVIGDVGRERPVLVTERMGVTFDRGDDVAVDVVGFERLAAIDPQSPGASAAWLDAIELRRGPFLAGFDASPSEEWDTWVVTVRTAIDERAAELLARLADACERRGDHAPGIELARRRLEIDAWNERAHRQLIRLLVLDDQRGAALAHADGLATALRDELGVELVAETQQLVDDIRSGSFPMRATGVPGLPLRPSASTVEPCVGRASELEWLGHHLDRAGSGSGRLVFVEGQAGSGKSVLVRAFAAQSRGRTNAPVMLGGTCNAFTGAGDPFLPFRHVMGPLCGDLESAWSRGAFTAEEVSQLWAGVPAVVEALLDVGPSLLGTLIDADALVHRFDDGFPGHPLGPRLRAAATNAMRRVDDPARRRRPLIDDCVRLMIRIARQRSLLITIDDLHWADAGTLELLLHLARQIGDAPILAVATYRPLELAAATEPVDPVAALVNEVRSLGSSESLLLLEGNREFVDAWLDAVPNALDEEFRTRLFAATHGHALFTVEMVRALRERGDLTLDSGGRLIAGPTIDWNDLPPRIEATIAARLANLPVEVRRDLEAASVQGTVFTAESVARVRAASPADVELRLGGLVSPPHRLIDPDGVVRVGEHRAGRFRFRHALFQQFLYGRLAPPERRRLHEATGRAIEKVSGSRVEEVAVDLAVHFDRAELPDEAVGYLTVAGRRSMRLGADAEAVAHLRRAIELLDSGESSADRDARALVALTLLGSCLQAHAGYNATETTEVYERIRELIPRVGPTLEAAQALGALITVDGLRARYSDAMAAVERLLVIVRELDATPIETVADMQAGWMLLLTGRLAEADERLRLAVERYESAWDAWLTYVVGVHVPSAALAWRAVIAWHLGQPDAASRLAEQSIASAREADYQFGLAFVLLIAGCLVSEFLERPVDVIAAADEAAAIADREDLAFYRAAALVHRGVGLALDRDFDRGLDDLSAGLTGWAELGTEAFTTWIRTQLAESLVHAGRFEEAGEVLDEVDRRLADGEEQIAALRLPFVRGLLLRVTGDNDGADQSYRHALELAVECGAKGPQLQAAIALADLLCDQNHCDEAIEVLEPVANAFDEGADTPHVIQARALLEQCRR